MDRRAFITTLAASSTLPATSAFAQNKPIHIIVPFLEHTFGFQAMPGDIYYITAVPSELRWPDVGRIGILSVLFSVVATLYPAWRAARTQPAQALRYE